MEEAAAEEQNAIGNPGVLEAVPAAEGRAGDKRLAEVGFVLDDVAAVGRAEEAGGAAAPAAAARSLFPRLAACSGEGTRS
jgi:hypothetical protein